MWHPKQGEHGGEPLRPGSTSKRRSLLVVVAFFVALYFLVNWQVDRSESQREKRICELVHGAGNCVRSGGEWVRIGSSPLFGP